MISGRKIFSATALITVATFQNNAHARPHDSEHYYSTRAGSRSPCALQYENAPLRLIYSQTDSEDNTYNVAWNFEENFMTQHERIPASGEEIAIVRCLPPGHYQTIAQGQVKNLNGRIVFASVKSVSKSRINLAKWTLEDARQGNLFLRPMVGDEIIPINHKIINKKSFIYPVFSLSQEDLFEKSDSENFSLSLSESGREILKNKFMSFAKAAGRIQIQGFALKSGHTQEIREESLLRAQAVASYLEREFELEPGRIVPIGYGNDWYTPGMNQVEQLPTSGIIMKVLPHGSDNIALR